MVSTIDDRGQGAMIEKNRNVIANHFAYLIYSQFLR